MSVLSLNERRGNQFFDRCPEAITKYVIFGYVKGERGTISESTSQDDKTILRTAAVCKNWQSNPELRAERQEATTRLRHASNLQEMLSFFEYPRALSRAFQESGQPISRLPVLELDYLLSRSPQGLSDSYFTGIYPLFPPELMNQSIMRLRAPNGRIGIAFKIVANGSFARSQNIQEIFDWTITGIRYRSRGALHCAFNNIRNLIQHGFRPREGSLQFLD